MAQLFFLFLLGGNFFILWFWKKTSKDKSLCLKAKLENFKRPQSQRHQHQQQQLPASISCVDGLADQFYEASQA